MKTEDLQAKGLTQEQIDYVMAEYGKDINGIKQERDTYKTQLCTAQATLKSFEGVNISELQGKIQTLTTDLANKDAEYQKQLAERDFNDLLKTTAEGFKPRDIKAVMLYAYQLFSGDSICAGGGGAYRRLQSSADAVVYHYADCPSRNCSGGHLCIYHGVE